MQVCIALGLILYGIASPSQAGAEEIRFSVKPKPLGAALVDFAVQADVSIATPNGGFKGLIAGAVQGEMSRQDALRRLLTGTGFTFEQIDAVSFRVVPASVPSPLETASRRSDVIVTGARRPRVLDRVAMAVTTTRGDYLDKTGVRQTADIAFDAAGITLTNLGSGRNKIIIRGLSDGAFSGRTQATVGNYFGDSRITYGAPDPDLELVDIASVEVLRGPQGALYGAGPIGGVFQIVPRSPDLKTFGGSLSAGVRAVKGGGVGNSVEAVLNVPLVDGRAGLRAVLYDRRTVGWLDNPRLGANDTNESETIGGRLSGLVRVGDTWTVSASIVGQNIASGDADYLDVNAAQEQRSARLLEPYEMNFHLASLAARGAAMGGEVTSVTSYTSHKLAERFDASAGSLPFGFSRTRPITYDSAADVELFGQELRYAAVSSAIPWFIGAFFSESLKRSDVRITADPDIGSAQLGYHAFRRTWQGEFALFGDVTFNLTDLTQLSLAGRYSWSDMNTRLGASGGAPDDFSGRYSESGFSPRVELSYAPSPRRFYYVSAAQGFRSGGFNGGSAALIQRAAQPDRQYGGDKLWSYEVGTKQERFSGRLITRASVFYQDWRNVQSDQLISAGLPFTGNVGDASSYGLEIENVVRFSQSLELRGHASYTQTEVTSVNPSFPSSLHSGLPGAPRVLAGGSISYERPIATNAKFMASSRARYIGRSNIAYSRQRELRVGGYFDLDARVGVSTSRWMLSVAVSNILGSNERTFSYGNPVRFGGFGISVPQAPQTISASLGYNF